MEIKIFQSKSVIPQVFLVKIGTESQKEFKTKYKNGFEENFGQKNLKDNFWGQSCLTKRACGRKPAQLS